MRWRSATSFLVAAAIAACGDDAPGADDAPGSGGDGGVDAPLITECNDGIDNDGDGYVDWQADLGCYGPGDGTEAAAARAAEHGFTTYEIAAGSVAIYVAADGDDAADGLTPATAVRTLTRGAALVRDGQHDFLLLRRGDTWRDQTLGRFKSGRDATHPLVVGAYGDSTEPPRIEVADFFINHDGQARSFVALIGLHFVHYKRDPADPGFDGTGEAILRYVGGGQHLLIEGCHFEFGELVVQSCCAGGTYQDVEIRRNVVERSYHASTCSPGDPNGDATFRPSGIYASHVERLTIEGNLFDHNGWNPTAEPTACATIYNHNLYLNANGLVIRDNILARASSIHIKLRSDTTGDMTGTVIENNFFTEGEIGISIGGNATEPYRFVSGTIRRNVMSDIGRTRPTTRTLAWGIDIQDNDGLTIEDNHFLNQREPGVSNSYAINIAGGSERGVAIEGNTFYRIQGAGLRATGAAAYENLRIADNTFADPDLDACLINHSGASFAAYTYANNRYFSGSPAARWFCVGAGRATIEAWRTASGEATATALTTLAFPEPDRTVERYAGTLGLTESLAAFLGAARGQSRLTWRDDLAAPALLDYIRAGF